MLILLLAASPDASEKLDRARRMVDVELRYDAAIKLLRRALSAPDLTKPQRVEAYRLLGVAYGATGSKESAEAAFGELLELAPDYQLDPLLSPKIRAAFERARRAAWKPVRILDVRASPDDRRVSFFARLDDPDGRVDELRLHSSFDGETYEAAAMTRDLDGARAMILLPALDRIQLSYFVEAIDRTGLTIARAGSQRTPSTVMLDRMRVTTEPPTVTTTPWYERWWVWAIVGGVVVAATTGAVVATQLNGGSPPDGTLDPIQLE